MSLRGRRLGSRRAAGVWGVAARQASRWHFWGAEALPFFEELMALLSFTSPELLEGRGLLGLDSVGPRVLSGRAGVPLTRGCRDHDCRRLDLQAGLPWVPCCRARAVGRRRLGVSRQALWGWHCLTPRFKFCLIANPISETEGAPRPRRESREPHREDAVCLARYLRVQTGRLAEL